MRISMNGLMASALIACAGGDPLDTDDPYPVAPGVDMLDGGAIEQSSDDSGDSGGGGGGDDGGSGDDGSPDTGSVIHGDCLTDAPETLEASMTGASTAEVVHSGVDLPLCAWEVMTTVDVNNRQISMNYVTDEVLAECGDVCDHEFMFELSDVSSGRWTIIAGARQTVLSVP